MKRYSRLLLLLILLIGIVLRFYKLDWGDGLFPHPDERNIAGGIMNLSFPHQMNPRFFAYGGFPLYLYYFTGYVLNIFLPKLNLLSFENIILIGRFWSAFFSSLTLIIFYFLCRKFLSENLSILAVLLLTFVPGVIQQAHFATVETLMSFFLIWITLLNIKYLESGKKRYLILSAILGGLALGTKTTCLLFLPPIFLTILIKEFFQLLIKRVQDIRSREQEGSIDRVENVQNPASPFHQDLEGQAKIGNQKEFFCHPEFISGSQSLLKSFTKMLFLATFALLLIAIFFSATNPYVILDYPSFYGSMNYETGVGLGNPIVFYTRQFEKTTPVIFQFTKIFPYALGPSITIYAILGILLFSYKAIRERKLTFYLLLFTFYIYLIPNLIIFAKWTRFVAPVFPFFVFFAVYFLSIVIPGLTRNLYKNTVILGSSAGGGMTPESTRQTQDNSDSGCALLGLARMTIYYFLLSLLLFPTLLWGLAFFSIYTRQDIRWTASDWMIKNLKPKSHILFETGNVIDVPLGGDFTRTSYDFFHIDQNKKQEEFFAEIEKADYFLIQSRRVWANYTRIPQTHPTTAKFYDLLWSGKLGFTKIAEFDSFPQIFGIKINDELAEETFTVFDHPHMSVWKKTKNYNRDYYSSLF